MRRRHSAISNTADFWITQIAPNEAEAQFKKAVEVEPKNIEARETIAAFYVAQKQFEKAEQIYKDLVQIQENSSESRVSLGRILRANQSREDDAIKILSEILAETPEYVRARYRLGEIYLERKEFAKVNEQIEALLQINDNDTEALMLRARVRLQENKAEEAVKDLEEVLKKQPSHRERAFLYDAGAARARTNRPGARVYRRFGKISSELSESTNC